jgi:hypothetical protein
MREFRRGQHEDEEEKAKPAAGKKDADQEEK